MSKLKVTLPGLEIPVTGKQISFKAPCDCSSVECLQIDGVDYIIVDALGRQVTGTTGGGVWAAGAKVSVILDCEEKKAYLQNGNPTLSMIGAGMVNPNLLHNWYFANPVNQRGETEYPVAGYTIDRWISHSNNPTTLTDKGVKLTDSVGYVPGVIWEQRAELNNRSDLAGRTVTVSVLVSEISGTYVLQFGGSDMIIDKPGLHTFTVDDFNVLAFFVRFYNFTAYASITMMAAKVELGSTQTLAHQDANGNWVLNEIPDYNEELLKCCMSKADPADDYANNKKTPAAINAVSKSGDTMTGALTIETNGTNRLTLKDTSASAGGRQVRMQNNRTIAQFANLADDNTFAMLQLQPESTSVDSILRLRTKTTSDGEKFYNILHTGNMESLGCGKIATGSYVGTGCSGSDCANTLTFSFKPALVVVIGWDTEKEYGGSLTMVQGASASGDTGAGMLTPCDVTWDGNSVSWSYISADFSWRQYNAANTTYHWFAIG